jgi:predicted phosphodiesterase
MKCPRCGSAEATPWGGTGNARKRYKCKACGRQYYESQTIEDRYSPEEIKLLMEPRQSFSHESISFDGDMVTLGVMTDTHIGSSYTDESHILSALAEFERQGVSAILHAGDVTEGMSGRDGHVYELSRIGYKAQRDAAVALFGTASAPMYFISGNHDRWYLRRGDIGADIVGDIAERLDAKYLGHDEGDLTINGVVVRLWHGEDAGSYAVSYRLQKIVESFTGGEKPNVLIAGHTHKSAYLFDRNVHVVSAGSIQSQSKWMRGKRIAAHRGFWILRMAVADNEVKSFQPTWYPIY